MGIQVTNSCLTPYGSFLRYFNVLTDFYPKVSGITKKEPVGTKREKKKPVAVPKKL